MTTQEQLLTLLLNSKKGSELPLVSSLENTDRIIFYDPDTQLLSAILKSDLVLGGGTSSTKIPVTVNENGQSIFNIESKPDNIDLVINRTEQKEGTDYTYSNQTGSLIITNANIVSSITTNSLIDVRGYSNGFSKKQDLIISSNNQDTYTLLDLPKSIDLTLNRVPLKEDTDYTYDNSNGLITIINQGYIDSITLNSLLWVRKIF